MYVLHCSFIFVVAVFVFKCCQTSDIRPSASNNLNQESQNVIQCHKPIKWHSNDQKKVKAREIGQKSKKKCHKDLRSNTLTMNVEESSYMVNVQNKRENHHKIPALTSSNKCNIKHHHETNRNIPEKHSMTKSSQFSGVNDRNHKTFSQKLKTNEISLEPEKEENSYRKVNLRERGISKVHHQLSHPTKITLKRKPARCQKLKVLRAKKDEGKRNISSSWSDPYLKSTTLLDDDFMLMNTSFLHTTPMWGKSTDMDQLPGHVHNRKGINISLDGPAVTSATLQNLELTYLIHNISTKRDTEPANESAVNPGEPEDKSKMDVNSNDVLIQIMNDLEEIKMKEINHADREGLPCHVDGSWVSDAAGIRLDMTVFPNGTINIHADECIPPKKNGLLDRSWFFKGEEPFQHSGLIIVYSKDPNTKKIATFLGQCRVCGGIEMVTGVWVIARESRDCRDTHVSVMERPDIFRREMLRLLKNQQLRKINPNNTTVSTPLPSAENSNPGSTSTTTVTSTNTTIRKSSSG